LIKIESPDDPRIEPYRSVRERDLLGRAGRFIAEGEVVVRILLSGRSRFAAASVLVAEGRVPALSGLLAEAAERVPVFVAGQTVMDAVVGFPIHRGLLALGIAGGRSEAGALLASLPERAAVLGLVGIANHDNMGGAFRNAAAFGAAAVLLAGGSCDPLYRKAIRVSVGGTLLVPHAVVPSAAELVELLRAHGFEPFALSPAGRETLGAIRWPRRPAILVGAEGHGLPPEVLESCRTIRIPMAGGFDSLNVATAAGIALHAVVAGADDPT
jgi:tRNA G18 (ribose-2'-O)-methylase SpoU